MTSLNTLSGFGCAASKLAAQTYPACAATDAKELRVGAVVDGDTVTGKQVDSGAVGSGALGLLQNSVQQLRAGAASHRHAYPLRALSMQQQSKGSSEPHNFCITTTDNMPRCTAAIFSEKAGMCAAHIMKVETPTELGAPRWHWPLPTRAQKLKQALESPRSPSTSSNDVSASAAPPTSVLPTAADKILSSSWSGPLSSLVRGGSVSHAVPSTPGEIQQLHAQPLTAYASAPGTPTRAASRMAGPRQSSMASDELRSQCGMSPSLGARPSSNLAQLNLTRQFSSAGSLPSLRPASSAGPLTTSRPGFGASRYSGTVDRSSTATLQREGHYAAMARMQTPLQHETAGRAAAPPPPRQTCTRSWAPPATAFVLSSELPSRGAVYSVFQNLDPRSNGQVVFSDFEEAGILVGMTHTQIQNLFKALDKAGKGYLTVRDWAAKDMEHRLQQFSRLYLRKTRGPSMKDIGAPEIDSLWTAMKMVVSKLSLKGSGRSIGHERVLQAFEFIDYDSNGSLDRDELLDAFHGLGINIKQEVLDDAVRLLDKDVSGNIDYYEFVQALFPTLRQGCQVGAL